MRAWRRRYGVRIQSRRRATCHVALVRMTLQTKPSLRLHGRFACYIWVNQLPWLAMSMLPVDVASKKLYGKEAALACFLFHGMRA